MKNLREILQRHLEKGIATPRDQRGVSLVESLVAVAILGTAIVALLAAASAGSIAVGIEDQRLTVDNMVQSQLEYTKDSDYIIAPATYPAITPPPGGYSVTAEALPIPGADDNIQLIKVTAYRNGKALLTVEDFKVNP